MLYTGFDLPLHETDHSNMVEYFWTLISLSFHRDLNFADGQIK